MYGFCPYVSSNPVKTMVSQAVPAPVACNVMLSNAMQCNAMQCNAMHTCNAMQGKQAKANET